MVWESLDWVINQHFVFINRGDPVAPDFVTGDLTKDGNWHTLDLRPIISQDAKIVQIHIIMATLVVSSYVAFRPFGNVNNANATYTVAQVGGVPIGQSFLCPVNRNSVVEYMASNVAWGALSVTVGGWFF